MALLNLIIIRLNDEIIRDLGLIANIENKVDKKKSESAPLANTRLTLNPTQQLTMH